jgi:uncharacterized protein DUF2752
MRRIQPIISPILNDRAGSLILTGAVFTQIGMTYFYLPGWQCPIYHATGIPCPGCGLSRAIILLLHGDWQASLHLHVFAPIVLLAISVFAIITVLPAHLRRQTIDKIYELERSTLLPHRFLIGVLLYWSIRLAVNYTEFVSLINTRF